MKNYLNKTLSLFLPVIVLALAFGPSTAGASWLLLLGSGETLLVEVDVAFPLIYLLVSSIPLEIHCEEGEGTLHASLNSLHTTLISETTVTFWGCLDLIWEETCEVRSLGHSTGTEEITVTGPGVGGMDQQSDLFFDGVIKSHILYDGVECPLTEIDGHLSGEIRVEMANPLTHSTTHAVTLTEQVLEFGESGPAVFESTTGGDPTGTAKDAENVSVHLVDL